MVNWEILLKWGGYNKGILVENFPCFCKMGVGEYSIFDTF